MSERSEVGCRKSEPRPLLLFFLTLVVATGCSSAPEPVEEDAPLQVDDCISDEGQRFLTYCASKDAARLARSQHGIEVGAQDEGPENVVALPVDGAPLRGERDAPVTVHLFSDLGCEDCRAVYERLAAEIDGHPDEMRLVFRHAPMDDMGEQVARAAIAADEQGKFFDFVDALYEDGGVAPQDEWARVAEEAGLDGDRWEQDRRSPLVDAVLEHDAIHAEEVGVVQAPTFFINGIRKVGGIAIEEFDEIIGEEREDVAAMEEAGLSGADISWRRVLQNYQPVDWEEVEEQRQQLEAQVDVEYIPVEESPQRGAEPEQSLVTIVVFADFLCSHCVQAAGEWMELVERYEAQGLRLVYKNFPLSMHDGSDELAAASVLASQSQAFWQFYEAAYGGSVDATNLEATLRRLGWRGADFDAALTDPAVTDAIDADRRLGKEAGVTGTPTIFVNGIELVGVYSADELAPLLEDQIALAQSIQEMTGSSGEELYREAVEVNRGN